MLEHLKQMNPGLDLRPVTDPAFAIYGRVLDPKDFTSVFDYLKNQTIIPQEGNHYLAHDPALAMRVGNDAVYQDIFGNMPLEFGYVNGHNSKLNALEYHKSSEINLAATPLVLLLGDFRKLNDGVFHSKDIQAFYLPQDTAIEMYPMTLHFSPAKVMDEGFKCAVVLPKGTNTANLKASVVQTVMDEYLYKTNKWLLAHPDNRPLIVQGAKAGIIGDNIEIHY